MKKALFLSALLSLSLLAACTDEKDSSSDDQPKIEQPTKTDEQPTEQTISEQDLQSLVTAVKDKAFSSVEHEGSVLLEESYMKDGERADYMKHDITYRQNDEIEGMYGEHQLYYKKHFEHENDEYSMPTQYEGYIQPDKAIYRYNDSAGWQGLDMKEMGEIGGYERLRFLSPSDLLSMLEMNEESLVTKIVSDEFVTVSFEPREEDQMTLFYQMIENDSFYTNVTETELQFDVFEVNLILSRKDESLSAVTVYYKQSNVEDPEEYYEVSYNQQFTATALTEEIRPPAAVFAESNLNIWD